MVTEQTIGPCPVCGVGEFYEHSDYRWCNACGFCAPFETWNRLSSQAARIAALEAEAAPLRELWAAVDRIEAYHRASWQHSIDIEVMQNETIGIYAKPGLLSREPTLAAALIALAAAVAEEGR